MALDDEDKQEELSEEEPEEEYEPSGRRSRVARFAIRFLLVLGVGFVVLGLSLLLLFGTNNLQTSGGAILWGLLLLVVYGFFEPETVRGFLGQGELQAGSKALLGVLLVIGAVFLLNIIVRDRLGDKQLDVTKNKTNSLAPQTQTILKGLDQPVTVTVWYGSNASEMTTAYQLLQQYHKVNGKLSVKQQSVVDDPTTARRLGLQQDSVVFEYPGRQPQITTDATEAGLDTSLIRLSTGKAPKVYFVTGHGEGNIIAQSQTANSYTLLKQSLDKQGVTTAQLNLLTGSGSGGTVQPGQAGATPAPQPSSSPTTAPSDTSSPAPGASPSAAPAQVSGTTVPSDADEIVLLDPNTNLTQPEIDAVTNYLDAGGHMLVTAEPNAQTNVNDIIKKYGISFGSGVVLDQQLQYNQIAVAGVLVISQFGQHTVTRGLDASPALVFQSAPIEGQGAGGYKLTPLISTKNDACARTDPNQRSGSCQSSDRKGPFNLMVAIEQTNAAKDTKPTRVVALGGAALVSDQLTTQLQAPGNMPLMDNAINWLAGQDKIIDVPVRTTQPNAIFLTDAQRQLVLLGYPFLLPILVAAIGVVFFFRRR
jgi:ABC-type uncharacterized transport system involved in gliding motility auxiliary subunit